jgi:DGQHR domain-containing protein
MSTTQLQENGAISATPTTLNPISVTALDATQNGHRIFVTLMKAKDLIEVGVTDPYNSSLATDDPNQGYQRPPERSRITKIGSHLIQSIVAGEGNSGGLFPTAVILASREPLKYSNGILQIKNHLQIIDGQHRVNGMRYAIIDKGKVELEDFCLPCVIVEVADRITEMNQFNIINGNAKSVRTDLVNAILTATAASKGDAAIADKDRWKVVVTKAVSALNQDATSPWFGLIAMPDEQGSPKGGTKIIRATSVMTSLHPVYNWMKEFAMLPNGSTIDAETTAFVDALMPYWQALKKVVPDAFVNPGESVIQKTPGLFSLHYLLYRDVLRRMQLAFVKLDVDGFAGILEHSPEITDVGFWHKDTGRAAAYGSMKGFDDLYRLLADSIKA